ncbi:MAG: hypothetical protein HY695_30595 [Deltaproteobacteria bacterium]|nr:hypothetical protein [Deltaproteobacteria bacterium]
MGKVKLKKVNITVNNVNNPPVANIESVSANEDVAVPITLTGSDADGEALAFSIVSGPAHGLLSGLAPNLNPRAFPHQDAVPRIVSALRSRYGSFTSLPFSYEKISPLCCMGSWAAKTNALPKSSGPGRRCSASSGAPSVAMGTRGEKITTQMFDSLTSSATYRVNVRMPSFVTM